MFKLVVLSCFVALAAASGVVGPWGLAGLGVGPLGLGAPWGSVVGAPWGGVVSAPWGAGLAAPLAAAPHAAGWGGLALGAPALGAYNYRGPLSLAPGQPANILAADGRPLDTLSVNLDRAAHITAKAVSGHVLKKRSAPLWGAPLAVSHTSRIDLPARIVAAPLAHGPIGLAAPAALGWHGAAGPWGVGPLGAPLGLGHGLW